MRKTTRVAMVVAGFGLMAAPGGANAQTTGEQALRREIDELRRLLRQQQETIGELERRVQELRTQANEDRRVLQSTEQTAVEARKAATTERPLIVSTDERYYTVVMGISRMVNVVDAAPTWNLVMATAMLGLIPPVIVVLIMQRLFVKGLVESEK